MNAVQIYDSLLSGVTFTHGQLPPSVEKRLLCVSPGEIAGARAEIKAIPEMRKILANAEFQLRAWLMELSWTTDDDNKYAQEKIEELEELITRIHQLFCRLR